MAAVGHGVLGSWKVDQFFSFDPFGGLEDETRNDGLYANLSRIRWSLYHKPFELVVARILPFWNNLDTVANFEWLGAVAG